MERKDKISIALTLVGLGVSALTAYFTLFRYVDDLRAMVRGDVQLSHDPRRDVARIDAKAKHALTVSNVGSRTATVTGVSYTFHVRERRISTFLAQDCSGNRSVVEFETQPIVVRPGETIVTEMAFKRGQTAESEFRMGWVSFGLLTPAATEYEVDICLEVAVATPDNLSRSAHPLLHPLIHRSNSVLDDRAGYRLVEDGAQFRIEKSPFTIVRRTGPIF